MILNTILKGNPNYVYQYALDYPFRFIPCTIPMDSIYRMIFTPSFYSLMMEPVVWDYMWYVHTNNIPSKIYENWKWLWYKNQFEDVMATIQDVHVELNALSTEKAIKDKLATMRSIRTISNLFYYKGYKLKVDLQPFYKKFGLRLRSVRQALTNRTVEISRDGHVCVKACRKSTGFRGGNKCDTNTYSSKGSLYEWDWCDK